MNNTEKIKSNLGNNLVLNLTNGIYNNPLSVYIEYLQNAAESIDIAKKQKLYQSENEPYIYIQVDTNTKTVVIEDNAKGIESAKIFPILGNITQSIKYDIWVKIGRFAGLGYCEKLIFETSFYGENKKSIMIWDAKMLKKTINDDNIKINTAELISLVTDYSFFDADDNSHYFKVIMKNVIDDELLDVNKIRDYLSLVAPLPFENIFKIILNDEQLCIKITKTENKSLSQQENAILGKVYNIIRQNLFNETAEKLIQKIENNVRKRNK